MSSPASSGRMPAAIAHRRRRLCTRLPPHGFPRNGVVRTFQAVRLFKGLTVSENVEAGYVAQGLGRGEARRRARAVLAELGSRRQGRRRRRRAELWRGAARRPGARARDRAALPAPRRAGGRARAGGGRRSPASHRRDPDEARLRRPGDRAQHGARHESLRAHPRPRRRPHHRRRHAGRDPRQPGKSAAPISARAASLR